MISYQLEVCIESAESALIAFNAGATRVELCSNLIIGGTTPPTSLIELTKELIPIPVHILIRPRFGDFLYSPFEVEVMKRDVVSARKHLADGIVIGATTAYGKLDTSVLKTLIDLAGPMHLTLHRAFDVCEDPFETLETAIELGFHTILTSGQAASAVEGISLLQELTKKAAGRIHIMPGAGINASNIKTIASQTTASAFHLSAKELRHSLMTYKNPNVYMGLPGIDETTIFSTSAEEIIQVKNILDKI